MTRLASDFGRSLRSLRSDWARNRGNIKGRLVVLAFRLTEVFAKRSRRDMVWWAGLPFMLTYRLVVEWFLGIELPAKTIVGPGLIIYHGQGLVVRDTSIIGCDVTLRHNVTIGIKVKRDGSESAAPELGDGVEVGAGALIIGPVKVGNHVVIGAGAVVVDDVPDSATVVGNPAREVRNSTARVGSGHD